MEPEALPSWLPNLKDAIDRDPLVVSPETSLAGAIALVSRVHLSACAIAKDIGASDFDIKVAQTDCLLVACDGIVLGILTEQDIVQLTAQALDAFSVSVADVMVKPVITLPQRSIQSVFSALFIFRRFQIHHLPIVDDHDCLIGLISYESIYKTLCPANLLRLRRVSEVMTTTVVCAPLTATVSSLIQLMADHSVSCIAIVQQDPKGVEQPVGIVTEGDIIQFQALQIDAASTQARTVMSSPLFLLRPEDSLWRAHQEMQTRGVKRLVVSWNWGRDIGLITQANLLSVLDPTETYEMIEVLQQMQQQMQRDESEAETSSTAGVPTYDRQGLLDTLSATQDYIGQIIDDPTLSTYEMRSQIGSVLDTLEQLSRDIQGE